MQRHVLFICDFNSPHSRSLISYHVKHRLFKITVISTFWAEEMSGVELILLSENRLDSKSSIVGSVAGLIQSLSTKLYIRLSAFRLYRISKNLSASLNRLKLNFNPDVIHVLRTQPEGVASLDFLKKYDAPKFLTTWGQDFVLWAKSNAWLNKRTELLLDQINVVFPDNHRDERIIKEKYNPGLINSYVMPATGGLQIDYLNKFLLEPAIQFNEAKTFFTNRGYPSSFVKLNELLYAFKIVLNKYPSSHFYIDLMSRVNIKRDKTILKWISNLGLNKNVSILHLTREESFVYLKSCDYYLSATTSDGLPLSLLESLFFGIIPIVYNHESTLNLLDEFEEMYVYDILHSRAISEIIFKILEKSNIDRELNEISNRKVIEKRYGQSKNLKGTLRHYIHNE